MFSRLLYVSIMQWRIVSCKRWSGFRLNYLTTLIYVFNSLRVVASCVIYLLVAFTSFDNYTLWTAVKTIPEFRILGVYKINTALLLKSML